jgi:hypothetical protein
MKLGKIFGKVTRHVAENSVNYLTVAGIVLEVTAVAMAFKNGPKCKQIVDDFKKHEKLRGEKMSVGEKAKRLARPVAEIVVPMAGSIVCQAKVCSISADQKEMIRTLGTSLSTVTAGANAMRKEMDKIADEQQKAQIKDKVTEAMVEKASSGDNEYIEDTGHGEDRIVDAYTGRRFKGSPAWCERVMASMQRDMYVTYSPNMKSGDGCARTYNWFLREVGLDITYSSCGDDVAFTPDNECSISWGSMVGADGKAWLVMYLKGYTEDFAAFDVAP